MLRVTVYSCGIEFRRLVQFVLLEGPSFVAFLPRDAIHSAAYNVCPSVTFVYCVARSKHILKPFHNLVLSPFTILVCP